jgi:chemotaxis protein MotA
MFSIVGILLVFACVITGFLMEKGKLAVLIQPAELVTIGGAAIGTVLAANPMHILKKLVGGLMSVIKGSPFSKKRYVDTLKMLFDLFAKSRKEGAIAIESDVEDPEKSPIFSRYRRRTDPQCAVRIQLGPVDCACHGSGDDVSQ